MPSDNSDTERQRDNAHHAAVLDGIAKNTATKLAGLFPHGVRYIRDITGSNMDTAECRTIIITNLSKNIDLSNVLSQLRGKIVIKSILVPGLPGYGPKTAVVQFSRHECAQAIFKHYTDHPLRFMGGENNDEIYEASIIMPETDSYPISRHVNHALERGVTRHMEFRMSLYQVYEIIISAGFGFRDFGTKITGFTDFSQSCYRVEMCSIDMAEKIQLAYLTSEHNTNGRLAYEDPTDPVFQFIPDSCDQSLDTLLETGTPTRGAQLAREFYELLWNREGFRPDFQVDLPENIHVHLPLPTSPADTWWMSNKIPDEDAIPDAVREVTADWTAPDIEHWTGTNEEGRLCRWSRDPRSGAKRFEVFLSQDGDTDGPVASPTMYRDELIKEWLHYNIDSENPETQKALDDYFRAHGLLNLRKVNEYIRGRKSPPAGN